MVNAIRIRSVALVLLVAGPVALRAAEADPAAEAFQSVYGEDLKRVEATADAQDDIALAGRIVEAAKNVTNQPAFVAVLCEQAARLAGPHPGGYPTAVEAMQLLATRVAEKASACAERVVQIRQKQFHAAQGDARKAAGEMLIDALLALADANVAAGTPAAALSPCVRARKTAREIASPRLKAVEARAERMALRTKSRRDIENLKVLVERNPADTAVREKIVRLYLVDLDDPARAAKWLKDAKDPALLKYVPAAAKGAEVAPELACKQLGDWYRSLAGGAPPGAKAAMVARAKAYYQRFLELHTADDLDRTAVTLVLKRVEDELAKLKGSAAEPTSPASATPAVAKTGQAAEGIIKPGKWVDLLPLVDPAQDTVYGKWERQKGWLICYPAKLGRVAVPAVIEGSYRLSVTFARTKGNGEASFILPVGKSRVVYAPGGKPNEFFDAKTPPEGHTRAELAIGRFYTMGAMVYVKGDAAAITLTIDGKSHLRWKGALSALSAPNWCGLPYPGSVGLAAWDSTVIFKSAKLQMITGQATRLRPEAK
jgi:hypothetical protein